MSTHIDQSVRDAVAKHHWYQSIPLGDGLITPGETGDATQRKLAMMNLPENLTGKSVLDIGCNEGFFSFEAERRGASRVLAVDKGKDARAKFALVKKILGSGVEFTDENLFDIQPSKLGRFDIVFFLAVLHHLRYPILAIDRIFELTREFAVMEFVEAVPETHQDQSALVRRLSKKGHLHMLPTRTLALELLEQAGFARVEVLGTHRAKAAGPHRRMDGYSQQRVLLKALRK
jgi:tRNA (mo5U34)-methyltransferase